MLVKTMMQAMMHATMLVQSMMQAMGDSGVCDINSRSFIKLNFKLNLLNIYIYKTKNVVY